MEILLRPATLADVAFLANVVITATQAQARFSPRIDIDEFRTEYETWTRETVLGEIPDCILSVIECDGEPIGRLRVVRTNEAITLAGIQILPAYQNRRIGSTLIEQLKHEADQKQCRLFISVEKDNPNAQRLYERLGFQRVGEDEREYHLAYHG